MLNLDNTGLQFQPVYKSASFFSWLMILLIFSSCEYKLDEIELTKIDQTPKVEMPNRVLDFEKDTLLILYPSVINYDLTSQNYKWVEVDVYFGAELIFTSDKLEDSFTLGDTPIYEVNNLKFQIFTNSGTGSLADEGGYEAVLFEKEWIVTIDTAPAEPMEITKINHDDGVLRIEWKKYSRHNFKSYYVQLTYEDYSYNNSQCPRFYEITDVNKNYLVDSIYLGGELTIGKSIRTINSGYDYLEEIYYDPLPKISFSAQGKNEVLLEWNRTAYDKAFGELELDIHSGYYDQTRIFRTDDVNITSYLTDAVPKFGDTYRIDLTLVPKVEVGNSCFPLYSINYVHLGNEAPFFKLPFFSRDANIWYGATYDDGITRWGSDDPMTLEIDINNLNSVGISPNREYLYICSDDELIRLDPENLDIQYSISLDQYLSKYYTSHVAVSDNNSVMLSSYKDNSNRDILLVDMSTGDVSDSFEAGVSINLKNITTNSLGNVLLYDMTTEGRYGVNIVDSKFINKDTPVSLEGKYVDFNPLDDNEVFAIDSYRIIKYNSSNWQIIDEVPISKDLSMISVDKVTGNIGGLDVNHTYFVFDSNSGEEIDSIKCYMGLYGNDYYLHNNTLYTSGMSVVLNQ